jgi:hypothetical protein
MNTNPRKAFLQRSRRRGANAIEFALTLPIFLYMMLGVVDYGYLMMAHAVLDAAVMEGTREGAITDPNATSDITTVAENKAQDIAGTLCGGDCVYNCADVGNPPEREITCDFRWNIEPLVGLVPYPNQIQSEGRQLLEWQRAR